MQTKSSNIVPMGEYVKALLIKRNFRVTDFASLAGISHSTLYGIIRGDRKISTRVAVKFERILGRSVDFWLLDTVNLEQALRNTSPHLNSLSIKGAREAISKIDAHMFENALQSLERFTGNDDERNVGNYEVLNISCVDLQLIKSSISFVLISRQSPEWSRGIIFHLNGALELLKHSQKIFPAPVRKSWDGMINSLSEILQSIKFGEE